MSEPTPPTSSAISLRPATPLDADQISYIGTTVFTSSFGHAVPPEDLAIYLSTSYSPSAIAADIRSLNSTVIVACPTSEPEKVLGFLQVTSGTTEKCIEERLEDLVELQRLYVHADWSGKGIGNLLIGRAVDMANEMGRKTMWLGVWEHNPRAYALYQRWGFEKVGDHEFAMGSCRHTDWILCKKM